MSQTLLSVPPCMSVCLRDCGEHDSGGRMARWWIHSEFVCITWVRAEVPVFSRAAQTWLALTEKLSLQAFLFYETSPSQPQEDLPQSEWKTHCGRMSFSEKQRANGVHTNNRGLIRIAKQEKASDVNAFSTVVRLENASRLREGIKHTQCVAARFKETFGEALGSKHTSVSL